MLRADDLARAERLLNDYIHGSQDIDELWESHHELHLALLGPAASEWDLRTERADPDAAAKLVPAVRAAWLGT